MRRYDAGMPPKPPPSTLPGVIADLDRFQHFTALSGRSTATAAQYRRYVEIILVGLYTHGHADFTRVRAVDLVSTLSGVSLAKFNVAWAAWRAWVEWTPYGGHAIRVPALTPKAARDLAAAVPAVREARAAVDAFYVSSEAVTAMRRFLFLSGGGLGVPLQVIPTLTRGVLVRRNLPARDDKGEPIRGMPIRHAVVVVPRNAPGSAEGDEEVFRPRSEAHAVYTARAMQTYVRAVFPTTDTPELVRATRNYPLVPDSEDGRRHITLPRLLQLLGLSRTSLARDVHVATELHRTQEAAAGRDFTAAFEDAVAHEAAEARRAASKQEVRAHAAERAQAQTARAVTGVRSREAQQQLRRGIKSLGAQWFDMPLGAPVGLAEGEVQAKATAAPPATDGRATRAAEPAGEHPRTAAYAAVCVPPGPSSVADPPAPRPGRSPRAGPIPVTHPNMLPRDELDGDLDEL